MNGQEINVKRDVDRLGHRYYYAIIVNPHLPAYSANICVVGSTESIVKLKCELLISEWENDKTKKSKLIRSYRKCTKTTR